MVAIQLTSKRPNMAIRKLLLESREKRLKLRLHLLDAGSQGYRSQPVQKKRAKQKCERPRAVLQNDWREGLPAPEYDPERHDVRHVIIHHSAGNTQNSDTRSVVRNIYLQHTQVNGWSDIGYNFLIGINGKIFEGRDGMGAMPDHEVKGAHFCGKNSNTMGVCLIGNYEENPPPMDGLNALKSVLAWQMHDARLNPGAFYKHPEYANDPEFLGTLAGHKDGCATLCPGKNLYGEIPAMKGTVSDSLEKCTSTTALAKADGQPAVYYRKGQLVIEGKHVSAQAELSLTTIQGKPVVTSRRVHLSGAQTRVSLPYALKDGIYVLQVKSSQGNVWQQQIPVF